MHVPLDCAIVPAGQFVGNCVTVRFTNTSSGFASKGFSSLNTFAPDDEDGLVVTIFDFCALLSASKRALRSASNFAARLRSAAAFRWARAFDLEVEGDELPKPLLPKLPPRFYFLGNC